MTATRHVARGSDESDVADAGHRCSYLAGLLGDPLIATATEERAWLLVEHEGPWGKNALKESGLPGEFVQAVRELSAATGVRVQLITPPNDSASRHCYLAGDPVDGPAWLAEQPNDDLFDVLDVDFAALGQGRMPTGATPVVQPLYAVCANDRSDPCCGRTGPAVWAQVHDVIGDRCRRTAHVGGHKYASNMVAFPYAMFYGRLDPLSALDVVAAHDEGEVFLDRYRGRSAFSLAEQAGEHFLRLEFRCTQVDGMRLVRRARPVGDDLSACTFAVAGELVEVVVGSRRRSPARLQSCTDAHPTLPVEWSLEDVRPSDVGGVDS